MKKNLFEMGASFDDSWSSDNKTKVNNSSKMEIKTPKEHRLHFAKEKRRGKVVTIVKPFFLDPKELNELSKKLKKMLGIGGTSKDDMLEFQGEVQEKLKENLTKLGFRFK
jgi:translation initiation factor 1